MKASIMASSVVCRPAYQRQGVGWFETSRRKDSTINSRLVVDSTATTGPESQAGRRAANTNSVATTA